MILDRIYIAPPAPERKTAGGVITNFAQVVKEGELRRHPQIGGLEEKEMLEKMDGSRGPVTGPSCHGG